MTSVITDQFVAIAKLLISFVIIMSLLIYDSCNDDFINALI